MKNIFNLSIFKKSESVTGNKYVQTPFRLRLNIVLSVLLMLFSVSAWGADTWNKVTSTPADWSGEYLLVYESSGTAGVAWTGVDAANCNVAVTISSGVISTKPASAVSIIIASMSGGYSIKVNGGTNNGKYIKGTSGSNALGFDNSAQLNTLAYASSSVTITSNTSVMRYNSASGNCRFRYFKSSSYSSQQVVQLYKKTSSGGDPTLSSISVKTAPTKVSYTEGEFFDPTGLVITRTYSNSTSDTYAYAGHTSEFSFTPSTSTALTTSNTSVTITYGGKSTTQAITVTSGGGGGGGCSYDLSTNSYASASTTLVTWNSNSTATMTVTDGTSTNANNYIPLTKSSTRFYSGATLTITPKTGKTITSIIFTATSDSYATALKTSSWTNATSAVSGSTVTITPTTGTSAVSATIGGTCGFTCVEFVEGSTYTITATVDDPAHGSVSVSGNIITVTPTAGWVPNGYTVTSGTATAVQSGNIFTVTPSSDCTIRINFRAAATYTITINDNGGSYEETAYEGVPYDLPDEGLSTCPDATLLGWATGEYAGHLAGTTTEPDYDGPGASKDITENTTFVAVYGVVTEDASDDYSKITSVADLKTGDYIIAAHGSYGEYAMKNVIDGDHMDEETFSKNANPITTTNTAVIWRITKTGTNYTIYNDAVGKYLAAETSGIGLSTEPHNYTVAYSTGWAFQSTTTGYQLAYDEYFRSLGAQDEYDIYLYRRASGIGRWTSKPYCCHEPLVPLEINTDDPTTMVGSGVVHLTTNFGTGGNGQVITWTTTGGSLSGQDNTGATLTLSAPGVYTVTATQAENASDPENVICGAVVNMNITVKSQWTITYKTIESGAQSTYNTITVTDGDSYTLPDIGSEFDCGTSGKSFAGWSTNASATSVEQIAGASITATANTTWFACWASAEGSAVYQEVTNISQLTAGDKVIFGTEYSNTIAMGVQNGTSYREVASMAVVTGHSNQRTITSDVSIFTIGGNSTDGWTFQDDGASGKYLYANSNSSNNYVSLKDDNSDGNTRWDITIGTHTTVIAKGSNSKKDLRHNNSSSRYACYAINNSQYNVIIYKRIASATTDHSGCVSGATIRVTTDEWITAAAGQRSKREYDLTAFGFDDATTLEITNNTNANFSASLAATGIPAAPGNLNTKLIVSYAPSESNIANETTTITLTAGDVTKDVIVHGRSLPDEFLMISKSVYWYAVPANMNAGPDQYSGVVVTPNDGTTPTIVPIAPTTVIYSLHSVDDSRYDDHGECVRLAGLDEKGLWGTHLDNTHIENKDIISSSNTPHYEWLLTTTDGIHYKITNPNNTYSDRSLSFYSYKYGLYKQNTEFFLVPAGCSSQPQDVYAKARRVDVTFSWISNASEMLIEIWKNEEMTGAPVMSVTATSSPKIVLGFEESTDYWFKLTPDGNSDCAYIGTFQTTGPTIEIVEWGVDEVTIMVDKDEGLHPHIVIDGEVEHGAGTGAAATEIFFSKYFEGSGSMKLIAIFNGTSSSISLSNYKIIRKKANSSDEYKPAQNVTYDLSTLGSIAAGQEIIFFTRPTGEDAEKKLGECSAEFIESIAGKSGEGENPRWIECNGSPYPAMDFNGNDAVVLTKSENPIDVVGALNSTLVDKDKIPNLYKNCRNESSWKGIVTNMDYGKTAADFPNITLSGSETYPDYGVDMTSPTIEVYAARCILFRDKNVTSGEKAVALNTTDFVTLSAHNYMGQDYASEWNGRYVCTSRERCEALGWTFTIGTTTYKDNSAATCNSYEDLGVFDYTSYYKDWENKIPEQDLDQYKDDEERKTYTIDIDNMAKYSCLNLRFQLTDPEDPTKVYTETPVQVPIIVTGNHGTADAIFNEIIKTDGGDPIYDQSITRCQTCDVVILGNGKLTKVADGTTHDVPQIGNLKIYPGGQLIVPSGTNYDVNSVAFRRQDNDPKPSADIQGTLNITGGDNSVYLDVRVDPTNWHFISLPYDCKVSDIRFSDPNNVVAPVLGSDFLLMWYDGARRAATKNDQSWEYVTADATLKKGLGYIYSLPGNDKVRRELRFPMSNDVIPEDLQNKNVEGLYGYGCNDDELRPNHKGWNLIGAPYLMSYTSDITTPLRTGKLIEDHSVVPWDGQWTTNGDGLRYIAVPINNGWDYYEQVPIAAYEMDPFTCYFIQVGGSDPTVEQGVVFDKDQVNRSSIVRRHAKEYEETEDTHPVWCAVDITNTLGETDETTLLISNDFTDNYDMMNDLVKMRGSYYSYYTRPVIASRNNDGEMAFNALPDASAEAGVPLNYFAASTGEYTIAYNDKYGREEIKAVMLNDKQTGQWIDLMENSYTFASNRVDNTDRFVLIVRVERKKTPENLTDIENLYNGTEEGPRKLLINGHVYILRGGQLFDITGKQVKH